MHVLDAEGKIRQYFTDKGLEFQRHSETMPLPRLVDQITDEVTGDPGAKDFMEQGADFANRVAFVDFLDRFEDRFYSLMQGAIKDRKAKDGSVHQPERPKNKPKPSRRGRRRR